MEKKGSGRTPSLTARFAALRCQVQYKYRFQSHQDPICKRLCKARNCTLSLSVHVGPPDSSWIQDSSFSGYNKHVSTCCSFIFLFFCEFLLCAKYTRYWENMCSFCPHRAHQAAWAVNKVGNKERSQNTWLWIVIHGTEVKSQGRARVGRVADDHLKRTVWEGEGWTSLSFLGGTEGGGTGVFESSKGS